MATMTAQEMQDTLKMLRSAVLGFEALAIEYARLEQITTQAATMESHRTEEERRVVAVRQLLDDEAKAAEAARTKRVRDEQIAVGVVDERLKDLIRSQAAAEQQLDATKVEIARLKAQQDAEHARVESSHEDRIAGLQREEATALVALADAQAKVKALHSSLAGAAQP